MRPPRKKIQTFALGLALGAFLFASLAAATWYWFCWQFERGWTVPHAVTATGQLVDQYRAHRDKHGTWPDPTTIYARDVNPIGSERRGNGRSDAFDFGGGLYVVIELYDGNHLHAFATRQKPNLPPLGTSRPASAMLPAID